MNLTIEQKLQMYCDRMQQIVYRLHFVDGLISGYGDSPYLPATVECIFLQLRIVLELIATASLIVNDDAMNELNTKFKRNWHAIDILEAVESVNPNYYYPKPVRQVETNTPSSKVDFEIHIVKYEPFNGKYLSRTQFTTLYDICSKNIHIPNPFDSRSYNKNAQMCIDLTNKAKQWRKRIIDLLTSHLFKLDGVDDTVHLAYTHSDGKNVEFHVATLSKMNTVEFFLK